jgi:hypothetical protein
METLEMGEITMAVMMVKSERDQTDGEIIDENDID